MRVTSLLCGPWADLWPFNGLYCKPYAADRCASVQSFVPYKAFQAGLSIHINSGVYSQKRCVVWDRLIICESGNFLKNISRWNTDSRSGGTLISPPMVAALTRYSFPTLKLYFKTQLVKQANRNKTKRIDAKQSQATWSVAVLKISN